ncbi:MAG: hypothetical protein LBD34_00610, partial [Puniceicoccales bacterium]|nr:hypothetical protein [Puniceicoccales bacterium]
MESVNTTTTHRANTWRKTSLPGNDKPSAAMGSHDFRDSPNSQPFRTGKDTTVPSAKSFLEQPKDFVDRILNMLRRGESGIWLLSSLLLANKIPSFKPGEISSKEMLDILMAVFKSSNPAVPQPAMKLFRQLVLGKDPKLDLRCLSAEEFDILVNKLLEYDLVGVKCLADIATDNRLLNFSSRRWSGKALEIFINRLINSNSSGLGLLKYLISEDKLPNLHVLYVPEEFIDFCFSQGLPGIALLQTLMVKGKISNLDLSEFSREEAKAFADKLSKYGSLGDDFLAALIKQGKFPSLASLEDGVDSEPWYSVCGKQMSTFLEKARKIWQATVNEVVGLTNMTLKEARKIWQRMANEVVGLTNMTLKEARKIWQRMANEVVEQRDMTLREARKIWQRMANEVVEQRDMTLGEARKIWQRMANEVASNCFDATGNVDVKRIQVWMDFFGNAGNFTGEPFCRIPHVELMRSQMHRVCKCLVSNQNGARDLLNTANGISVGQNGQSMLATMSQGKQPPLKP